MPRHSSVARLLLAACGGQAILVLACLLWRWPASPLQALLGAVAILLVAPAALALELAIVARVGKAAKVPQPSPAQLVGAWWLETAHLFRTFYWRQPLRWRVQPDAIGPQCAQRVGVVLVHGFMCNRGFWNAWMRDFRARGHACVAVNLEPPFGSIDAFADAIDAAVERVTACTGRAPVLVCHSMGGLAARAWWRGTQGRRAVAHLVTIGSPHHGTWLARFSRKTNGRQMRLASDWLAQLARDEERHPLPPATCWYSNCDNVVFPADTATLPHADNRFVPGVPHVALAFAPQVRSGTVELVASLRVPCQGDSFTGNGPENI
ncbi:alpha/beta fold hydrolase [Ramlibacter sp. USB13]|uniref:Alpha/beta fold hydrolase n=1 Tax=Ramlibacter cellulosilyticus TaxID=2764187 RepID=A0A923MS73_9BURK|nr:alpha/beta fold hydrolase [Ramlibacter cellulosilyticus]MBC5783961.1 alpha/beta fold hydrolase [Ramlibacter cellulosilyticus]